MKVDCKAGAKIKQPKPPNVPTQSLLTNEEDDAKYRYADVLAT
jgi:hypothetical protein